MVIGQSTHSLPLRDTGLSLDLGSVSVASSFRAMAGTATAKRASSELAERSILSVFPPHLVRWHGRNKHSLFCDGGPQISLRIALPTHLIRRLKSCRVKLDSGNTTAVAIEFDLLIEKNCKILLSRYFSGF